MRVAHASRWRGEIAIRASFRLRRKAVRLDLVIAGARVLGQVALGSLLEGPVAVQHRRPSSTPMVYLHDARKRNQSSPPRTSSSRIEMSVEAGSRRRALELLAHPPLQHPVAAEPRRALPGAIADVDRPLGRSGDDPVDPLHGFLAQVAGQDPREAHPVAVDRPVDLRPLRLGRHREHVGDLELLDEPAQQVRLQELVLGSAMRTLPAPRSAPTLSICSENAWAPSASRTESSCGR